MSMHVVEVIPLSVLPPQVPQVLSYYADSNLPKGAIVQVPMGKREVMAVVISSSAFNEQRILVKKSAFQLKKIAAVLTEVPAVSEYQFKLALWMASEYLAPLGLAFKAALPPFFLKKKYPTSSQPLTEVATVQKPQVTIARAKKSPALVLEQVKKSSGQTLIVVPEMSYIPRFKKDFPEADIIHSAIKNSDYYAAWQRAASSESSVVIGTRQALFLPFHNLTNLILLDPLHEFYKSDYSPKYNTPKLAEYVAQLYGAQLTVISNFLGVEQYIRGQQKDTAITDTLQAWSAQPEVVDLVAEMKQGYLGALSVPLRRRIAEAVKAGQKILIFAARRGYAGIMACKKCGFTVNCPRCNIPMRVHQSFEKILVCHHCSTNQPYPKFCTNCHSSDIKPTGPAGSQKIFEELQKMMEFGQLDRVPTLILDADVTQNQTEEDEVMETVRARGPAILIATQKVFSYIFDDSFDLVAIPQFDALSTSADYQTIERLWYQLEKLADFEPSRVVLQTYDATRLPHEVFMHEYDKLYREESGMRKTLAYPPFSKLIRLTFTHRRGQTAVTAGRLLIEKLRQAATHLRVEKFVQISDSSPMFLSKERDIYTFTVIVKALPGLPSIRELIKFAPSHWLIDVDPRQII